MPGDSSDLQQWLDALKKRAEEEAQRKHGAPASRAQPAPRRAPQRQAPPARPATPQQSAPQRPSREELQRRAKAAAEREKQRRQEEARAAKKERAQAEAQRKKKEEEARRHAEAVRRRKAAKQKRGKLPAAPRSSLGLSGNLIHDLRSNPQALREAVLLLEILGPPLIDRDPLDRFV